MNIFWFKRDLRLEDNEALYLACEVSEPLILLYVLEPSLIKDPHTSQRHIQFIKESLKDLNQQLASFNTKILLVEAEVKPTFEKLLAQFQISRLFSTEEIGINLTYERDIEMSQWFKSLNINWTETQYNGVNRGLKNRKGWSYSWKKYMNQPQSLPDFEKCFLLNNQRN